MSQHGQARLMLAEAAARQPCLAQKFVRVGNYDAARAV
jgi:hypothetical protein